MGTDLTFIEPITPPDVRRPERLSKLPQWVQERLNFLKKEVQADRSGAYREMPVLPRNLILNAKQKILIEEHARQLSVVINMTPEEDIRYGEVTMTAVTKMQLVLPSRESGELAREAQGEAYMAALEDVPGWAVQEAVRKWYRAEYGPKYDYRWQPAPAVLRQIAMIETYRVMGVRRSLNELLEAEPRFERSPEDDERMAERVSKLLTMRKAEG